MRGTAPLLLLLLSGCALRPRPLGPAPEYVRLGPLELSAAVERDAGDVMGSVDVMNTGREPVALEYYGSCAVAILLTGRPSDRPRWDALTWWRTRPGICVPDPVRLDIPPETLARILTPPVNESQILGDSIPAGPYAVALRIRIVQPHDTTLVLPAGLVELAGPDGFLVAKRPAADPPPSR